VGAKVSSDHGKIKLLKEAISCDAEEENKLSHPYGENKSGIWNPKLSPIARKHLSSFKFGRKKPSAAAAEPERKGNIVNTNSEVSKDHHNMKQQVASLSSTKLPGKSQALGGAKAVVVGAATAPNGPQLSKLNSVRAGSPMRAVQSGDSQPAHFAQGSNNTNGRIAEELNGQSRFSNITRRLAAAAAAARAQTQRRWFPGT